MRGGKKLVGINNPQVKYVRRLANHHFRDKEKKFLIEGLRFVEEAINSTWPVEMLVYSKKIMDNPRAEHLLKTAGFRNVSLLEMEEKDFGELAETATPQGIIAVATQRGQSLEDLKTGDGPALLVLVDGVQDPGNLGAIVRSADAAGAGGVILLKGTADIYNPKALRATMGSIFHLPVIQGVSAQDILFYLKQRGIKTVAGDPHGSRLLFEIDLKVPCALVAGSEAGGIGENLKENVDDLARIPMPGRAESLNVAISASIMLYEALRQRGAR
jgi:TrmH family RNA methyltransferase